MRYTLLLLLFTGCSYVHQFGKIGDQEIYKVNLGSVVCPGQTQIVYYNTNTHELTPYPPVGGNGVLPSAVVAAGVAGGAHLLGSSLRPDKTVVSQSGASTAHSGAESSSQSNPTITVQDPPPAPPLLAPRIKPPFGQKWR